MKTRRRSHRKRCLSDASSPDELPAEDDSKIATSSVFDENKKCKRISLSPCRKSVPVEWQAEESRVLQNIKEAEHNDDGDVVEFLGVIPPPPSICEMTTQPTKDNCKMSHINVNLNADSIPPQEPNIEANKSAGHPHEDNNNRSAFTATTDAFSQKEERSTELAIMTSPISSFPYITSAYLQSLAEISHAILWDARWRVGGLNQHRLFSWEQGDDMNAIHKFSRRFLQPSLLMEENKTQDTYSFEQDETNAESSWHSENCVEKENIQNTTDHRNDNNIVANEKNENETQKCHQNKVEYDSDDRCLEIYSRLYFRKGPWFRLDNIYKSYYLPDRLKLPQLSPKRVGNFNDKIAPVSSTKKSVSTSKFFDRRNKQRHQNSTGGERKSSSHEEFKFQTTNENDYIDQDFVDLQIKAFAVLLKDIKRLFRMGLLRSFLDEEECGRTVGKRREKYDYSASSLLRQDEQRSILTRLGGGQTRKHRLANRTTTIHSSGSSTTTPSVEQKQAEPLENLIWKQMCQQQTIFHSFQDGRNNTVLPVIRHVHKILVEKLASTIVLKANKVEHIPSQILRCATKTVYGRLSELTCDTEKTATIMCFRLREAPVRTLRRACRLYLCATSGPGDMRNNGTNAWRSLPDSHNKDLRNIPLRTNVVSPPGSSWNTVCYPGKDWRLRVLSCQFIRAYKPMLVNTLRFGTILADARVIEKGESINQHISQVIDTNDAISGEDDVQVFSSIQAFHKWEIGVELRDNCDFLLELNELLLYNERKRVRTTKVDSEGDQNGVEVDYDDAGKNTNESSSEDSEFPIVESRVDFLDVLTLVGRAKIIKGLLAGEKDDCKAIISEIEQDISTLLGIPFGDRPLSTLVKTTATESKTSRCVERSRLLNECEKILGVIGIILTHVLEFRNASINQSEEMHMIKRSWLRHMYWEGCMSYVLWDIIPIFERRKYYAFAINALEILLFGRRLPRAKNKTVPDGFIFDSKTSNFDFIESFKPLISRRARGKALDRLIIDYTHLVRKNTKTTEGAKLDKKKQNLKNRASNQSNVNELINTLTEPLIRIGVVSGQITFSSIRTLARRLKRPLSRTLHGLRSFERNELGHRLSNSDDEQQELTKYDDWTPITDTAVANAMATDRDSIGGRCSFIGFENDEQAVHMGSLNVEELAKEYYHQGRLPANDKFSPKGGWLGYHDEGGKIRILFRILSSATLGMDWTSRENSNISASDASTIHLTPYQGAPFDLHVGAECIDSLQVECSGIYTRRKSSIDSFLRKVSNLDGEDLSTLVYDCVKKRVEYTNSLHRPDITLEADLKQVRTLSMLAVGFGGKMLASIFRCLFFDYRHYSGGLPDLLLVRALYTSTNGDQATTDDLVDLGEWIGEEFSEQHQENIRARQVARIFMDTDNDFLGCSKVGDSGGRAINRFHRSSRQRNVRGVDNNTNQEESNSKDIAPKTPYSMPNKLSLTHNSQQIRVECMFVEVKSQNDRLDSRQEDWLNLLDLYGNARVCKFEKASKRDKATSS